MTGAHISAERGLLVFGPGQIGRWLGAGALATGRTVIPLRRGDAVEWSTVPAGVPLLVSVPEPALPSVLGSLPADRHDDAIVVQNNLIPGDTPDVDLGLTWCTLWVNRKPGLPEIVGNTTGVYGRHAAHVAAWSEAMGVGSLRLASEDALLDELAAKWAFLIAVNAFGVLGAITVAEGRARQDAARIVEDACRLAPIRIRRAVDESTVRARVAAALEAMAAMPCRGRTARARVEGALALDPGGARAPALRAAIEGTEA